MGTVVSVVHTDETKMEAVMFFRNFATTETFLRLLVDGAVAQRVYTVE
jgi:hypothetical protein